MTCHSIASINTIIKQFWELEEVTCITTMPIKEKSCEEHFIKLHERDDTGRYIIHLPIKNRPPIQNNSYQLTIRRLQHVKRTVAKNSKL